MADFLCHALPAIQVLFIKAILDGIDGIFLHQGFPVGNELGGGEFPAGLGLLVTGKMT